MWRSGDDGLILGEPVTAAAAHPNPTLTAGAPALQLVCSEVWGGNRPIHAPVELPGLRGTLFSHPCQGGRGGDVHYLSVCGSGVLARVCIADVVGHGETVAKVSGEMHTHLRRCMNEPDQRTVLAKLNRILEERGLDAMTTAAAVTYYPPTQNLSFSYAGHPPGWFYNKAWDTWERLLLDDLDDDDNKKGAKMNLPLAVDANVKYARRRVQAMHGDRLVLITDGVLEAPGANGDEFGDHRVQSILDNCRRASCADTVDALLRGVRMHMGRDTLDHDDVTILVLEVVPGPAGSPAWLAIRNRILRPRGSATTGVYAKP